MEEPDGSCGIVPHAGMLLLSCVGLRQSSLSLASRTIASGNANLLKATTLLESRLSFCRPWIIRSGVSKLRVHHFSNANFVLILICFFVKHTCMLHVLLRVLPGQVLPQQQMNPMDLEVPRKGLHGDKVQYCQTELKLSLYWVESEFEVSFDWVYG